MPGLDAHLARLEGNLKNRSQQFDLEFKSFAKSPMFPQDGGALMAPGERSRDGVYQDACSQRHHDFGKTLILPLSSYLASVPNA